jgi:hypothetical protein
VFWQERGQVSPLHLSVKKLTKYLHQTNTRDQAVLNIFL